MKTYRKRADGLYAASVTLEGHRQYLYDRDVVRLQERVEALKRGETEAMKLGRLVQLWAEVHEDEVVPHTWAGYEREAKDIARRHGRMEAAKVRQPLIIQDLEARKATGVGLQTVRTRRVVWSQVLAFGVAHGYLDYNVAINCPLPKGLKKGHRDAPTDEEMAKVLTSWDAPFGLFAGLCLCTGLRRGEALALTWDDIDFDAGFISVTKALMFPYGNQAVVKEPKTPGSVRVVRIASIMRPHLEAAYAQRTGTYVFPQQASNRSGAGGGYMTEHAFVNAWKRYLKATGLTITCHQLRHGTATLIFEAGGSVTAAQHILGHSTPAMTQQVYIAYRRKAAQRDAETLENALNAVTLPHTGFEGGQSFENTGPCKSAGYAFGGSNPPSSTRKTPR